MLLPVEHNDRAVPAQGRSRKNSATRRRPFAVAASPSRPGESVDEELVFEYATASAIGRASHRRAPSCRRRHGASRDAARVARFGRRSQRCPSGRARGHGRRTGRHRSCDARSAGGQKAGMGADGDPPAVSLARAFATSRSDRPRGSRRRRWPTTRKRASPRRRLALKSPKLSAIGASRSIRRAPAGARRPAGAAHRGRPGCRAWRGPGTARAMS
jgi:hypothetical protein